MVASKRSEDGQEKEQLLSVSIFSADRPANPVARISKLTENDAPSPWGEGRVEGGRKPFEIRNPNAAWQICLLPEVKLRR
jgi:hypothetical protein